MNLRLTLEPGDVLVVHLREGQVETTLSVQQPKVAARSLAQAIDAALAEGYGECFWPAATGGQYWWMFNRKDDTLEVIAMWTRGGASLWEHVFRAADAASFVCDRLTQEINRLELA